MTFAPIALFVYNRPAHTRQTVEALQNNELAAKSDLFIFSDAQKKPEALDAVCEVRKYIRTISGFNSISIVERDHNFGLANSIIDGVSQLCNEYGRVIVLEDDLVTSMYFLKFMNEALNYYENTERVMHISGCRYPVEPFAADATFFLHLPLCWGWATWSRAWQHFAKDIEIMKQFDRRMIFDFNFSGTNNYWKQLEYNRNKKLNTWFVFWYATLFLKEGLALFPAKSLVKNIGMDGSGTHCGINNYFDIELSNKAIALSSIPITKSQGWVSQHELYFRKLNPALYLRAIKKATRIIKGLL